MDEPVLTQNEIDTLMDGVDQGVVSTTGKNLMSGHVSQFNFAEQYNILLGKLPRLAKVMEVFVKETHDFVSELVGREVEVTLSYLQTRKYSEYIRSLPEPTNINMVLLMPYRQPGLVVIDPRLLFVLVDYYFGGFGRTQGLVEGRSLTATELRLANQLLQASLDNLQTAWRGVADITFTHSGTEESTDHVRIMNSNDFVVEAAFQVSLDGNTGSFFVVLPYSFLESFRIALGAGGAKEVVEVDAAWQDMLMKEVNKVGVDASSTIDGVKISLARLMDIKVGDVVPFNMPALIQLDVEDVPVFRGTLGSSNGKNAIRISEYVSLDD